MDRLSNKSLCFLAAFLISCIGYAQQLTGEPERFDKDYKDPVAHEQFNKRRMAVGAWQINELKKGALVVRLKTNKMLLDELNKQGKPELAKEKELELHAINKNTMIAYLDRFKFCKVYFIASNHSDTLLKGIRSGIFLDTTLRVNPAITMNENFYLLAERDYAYNSSIGFVPEDSARTIIERGNPVREMAIVVKNKYGHQLKAPFPYYVQEKNFMDASYEFPIKVTTDASGRQEIYFPVNKTYLEKTKANDEKIPEPRKIQGYSSVKVKKQFTYEKIAESVQELDESLTKFYRENPQSDFSGINDNIRPFLY